jgi:hypothetical protein
VRTFIAVGYYPSVAETQTVLFSILERSGSFALPVSVPASIALSASLILPMLTQGQELKLYPGQSLRARRGAATAGSSMTIVYLFIETDLPYYSYEEPQAKLVKLIQRRGTALLRGAGAGFGGGGGSRPEGGGGGVPKPI